MQSTVQSGVDWNFIRGEEGYWLTGYVPNSPNSKGTIASGVTVIFGFDIGQHSEKQIKALPISEALKEKLIPYCGKKGANAVQALEQRYVDNVNWKLHQSYKDHEGFPDAVYELAQRDMLAAVDAQFAGPVQLRVTRPRGVREKGRSSFRDPKKGEAITQFVASDRAWVPGLTLTQSEADELAAAVQAKYYADLERAYNKAAKGGKHFSTLPSNVQTALMSLAWHLGPSFWAGSGARKEVFDAAARGDWADAVDTLKATPFPRYVDEKRRRAEAELIAKAMGIDFNFVGPKEGSYMLQRLESRSNYGDLA